MRIENNNSSLFIKLLEYAQGGTYPFHMPGHKRNAAFMPGLPYDELNGFPFESANDIPFALDITEIYGFDDLHNPKGILLETGKLAASLYESCEAFPLICGSTAGILAAIGAHTQRGDKLLADANCHRSVKNAARLFGLELVSVTPDIDAQSGVPCSVMPQSTEAALHANPGIRLVVITSPSYEGVVSDIASIADIVHKTEALLLVDCAHGAHLGFSGGFPKNPVSLGADLAVMSLHKTLPALTQCSLLHACSERCDVTAIRQMLGIFQTSSPSYVLMASIDCCLRLLDTKADELFLEYESNLSRFYSITENLQHLSVLRPRPGFFALDPGKIVIATKNVPGGGLSGIELSALLRTKYNIELERAMPGYAIAMTSICDTPDAFSRLADALIEIDKEVSCNDDTF